MTREYPAIPDDDLAQIVAAEVREIRNPLRREIEQCAASTRFDDMRRLAAVVGKIAAAIYGAGIIGFANIEADRRDIWQQCEHGPRCVIIAAIEDGVILDLVAFRLSAPNAWFLRTGHSWALGMDAITSASRSWDSDARVLLHATPLDWLRSNCIGACVVNWTDDARRTLCALPGIDVGSPVMAKALRDQLTQPLALPSIQVRRGARDAA